MRYVYCHPLFDERKCGHRFSYELMRDFEDNSLTLERFDYSGTGEARGNFCDVTLQTLRSNLAKYINNDPVCLIGTRLGATLALESSCSLEANVKFAILIEPIVNGSIHLDYLLKKQRLKDIMTGNSESIPWEKQNYYNLEGYKVNRSLLHEIRQFDLTKTSKQISKNTRICLAQITISSKINKEFNLLIESLKKNGIDAEIEVLNHPAFWERIPVVDYSMLTKRIVKWCK